MEIEITRISEKGQVVIPNSIRKNMKIKRSDQFIVFGKDNTIILKKVNTGAIKQKFDEIAVVGINVISDYTSNLEEFENIILNSNCKLKKNVNEIDFEKNEILIPPIELKNALGQHKLILKSVCNSLFDP